MRATTTGASDCTSTEWYPTPGTRDSPPRSSVVNRSGGTSTSNGSGGLAAPPKGVTWTSAVTVDRPGLWSTTRSDAFAPVKPPANDQLVRAFGTPSCIRMPRGPLVPS